MRIVKILAVLWVAFAASMAHAAELWMIEERGCPWCLRWHEEIGIVYRKTDEGQRAPLRRFGIHDRLPDGVELVSRPIYTPTFILVDDGREVGRIEGYPGEDFFWGLLQRMLDRIPETG